MGRKEVVSGGIREPLELVSVLVLNLGASYTAIRRANCDNSSSYDDFHKFPYVYLKIEFRCSSATIVGCTEPTQ